MATDAISEGEVIARIPRSAVLTASRGVVMNAMRGDLQFMSHVNHMNPWIPLLIALAAEYALKVMANNETCQ